MSGQELKLFARAFFLTLGVSFLCLGMGQRDTSSKLYGLNLLDYGNWSSEEYCPSGSFVIGMRLKLEKNQGPFGDDTGLNGIEFYCASPWTTQYTSITSNTTKWGEWKSAIFCPAFEFAVGFQLNQGMNFHGLLHGAVRMALYCSRDYGRVANIDNGNTWKAVKKLQGQGLLRFNHTKVTHENISMKFCDQNSALCSIQTRVEKPLGWGVLLDDLGLVTMAASCCTLED